MAKGKGKPAFTFGAIADVARRLHGLDYLVQGRSRSGPAAWETMAGFNVKSLALNYVEQCVRLSLPHLTGKFQINYSDAITRLSTGQPPPFSQWPRAFLVRAFGPSPWR